MPEQIPHVAPGLPENTAQRAEKRRRSSEDPGGGKTLAVETAPHFRKGIVVRMFHQRISGIDDPDLPAVRPFHIFRIEESLIKRMSRQVRPECGGRRQREKEIPVRRDTPVSECPFIVFADQPAGIPARQLIGIDRIGFAIQQRADQVFQP